MSVAGWGMKYANQGRMLGQSNWAFLGQEIFKKAVAGMAQACDKALAQAQLTADQIASVVPHQANLRIIDTLVKRLKMDKDKVFVNIHKYGNMSAATTLVAFVEAIEEGFIAKQSYVLLPAFGGGLTWSAHVVKWGDRTHALSTTDIDLPECKQSGLALVQDIIASKSL
jgi:3-oxoacyl-[acyl-carrier-protein] synthase-3